MHMKGCFLLYAVNVKTCLFVDDVVVKILIISSVKSKLCVLVYSNWDLAN